MVSQFKIGVSIMGTLRELFEQREIIISLRNDNETHKSYN